jgi:hypothetical protein
VPSPGTGSISEMERHMSKRARVSEARNWAGFENLVDEHDAIGLEVMQEVFARLPYGQKFTLSDGSVAHLEKLSAPELCPNEGSTYFQRPQFGVDVVIEGGKLDHIEISAFQTGSGMAVGPSKVDHHANTQTLMTSGGDTAETPAPKGQWSAFEHSGAGGYSATRKSPVRPERGKDGTRPVR